MTCGKSYLDVRQALDDLGIDEAHAAEIGLVVYKVGMTWPLERDGIRHFAEGLEEILVVEEKRALVENQLKEQLYNWNESVRPRVIGKFDEKGEWILPSADELTPARIARIIARRIARFHTSPRIEQRLAFLEAKERALSQLKPPIRRIAYFCSGCPHNTSTKVPEGSRALAGIGCHFMAQWMDRDTQTFTQMGGEGATWLGQAPFSKTGHVFQNLGDGTYYHSGSLAIRAAVAANVNITYKILYNDAVAMTGGQPVDGPLDVPTVAPQIRAEGVQAHRHRHRRAGEISHSRRLPARRRGLPPRRLDHVQREMRETPGVTAIIYDQTCAAEKRRRRKRGLMEDPPEARLHQRAGLRGLRRLQRQIELPVGRSGRDRIRPQAGDRSIDLQQGLLLRQRLLPQLRHRPRRPACASTRPPPWPAMASRPLPEPTLPAIDRALWHPGHRRRRHRRRHHRRAARHGRASRGQGLLRARHDRPGAKGRRRLQPCPLRQTARGHPRGAHRRRRRAPAARLRHRRRGHLRRAWPRSPRARPAPSSTPTRR